MGMRSSAFYASWVVTYVPGQNDFGDESFLKDDTDDTFVWERYSEVLLYLFVVTGVVLLLSVGQILPRSSPSLLFVWLMCLGNSKWAFFLCRWVKGDTFLLERRDTVYDCISCISMAVTTNQQRQICSTELRAIFSSIRISEDLFLGIHCLRLGHHHIFHPSEDCGHCGIHHLLHHQCLDFVFFVLAPSRPRVWSSFIQFSNSKLWTLSKTQRNCWLGMSRKPWKNRIRFLQIFGECLLSQLHFETVVLAATSSLWVGCWFGGRTGEPTGWISGFQGVVFFSEKCNDERSMKCHGVYSVYFDHLLSYTVTLYFWSYLHNINLLPFQVLTAWNLRLGFLYASL